MTPREHIANRMSGNVHCALAYYVDDDGEAPARGDYKYSKLSARLTLPEESVDWKTMFSMCLADKIASASTMPVS